MDTKEMINDKAFLRIHRKETVESFIEEHNDKKAKELKEFLKRYDIETVYQNIVLDVFYLCECNDDECYLVIPAEFSKSKEEVDFFFHNYN
jgi:hypothetical protein